MKRFVWILVCSVVALAGHAVDAAAQQPFDGPLSYGYAGAFCNPYGFGVGAAPYWLGSVPTPPYFALHPPVYYSYAVPRTFGYSPFPYPGTYRTPEVNVEQPEVIDNPYVEPQTDSPPSAADQQTVAHSPVGVILNPFYLPVPAPDQRSSARYTVSQP